MSAYTGIVKNIGENLMNGSGKGASGIAMYAGIGAAGFGAAGAVLSDDSVMSGAMNGGLFGAAIGAGFNIMTKGAIKRNINHGFYIPNKEEIGQMVGDFSSSFADAHILMGGLGNNEVFGKIRTGLAKSYLGTKDDKSFAKKAIENISGTINAAENTADMDRAALGLYGLGNRAEHGLLKFAGVPGTGEHATQGYKNFEEFMNKNIRITQNVSKPEGIAIRASLAGRLGLDSAIHHIAKPTARFVKSLSNGKFSGSRDMMATAFSGYGIYESYNIASDASNANYGAAIAGIGKLAAGKLAFGAANSLYDLRQLAHSKGVKLRDVGSTLLAVNGAKKFAKGAAELASEGYDFRGLQGIGYSSLQSMRQSIGDDRINAAFSNIKKIAQNTRNDFAIKKNTTVLDAIDRIRKQPAEGLNW